MSKSRKFTAALIAGGKAKRMGRKKMFLRLNGVAILDRTLKLLRERFDPVWIIGNNAEDFRGYDIPVFPDHIPDSGPLVGIYSALVRSQTEYTFCCACDMPFIRREVLDELVDLADSGGWDVILPDHDEKLHPLFAFYGRNCVPVLERLIEKQDLKMHRFLEHVSVRKVTFDARRFGGISPFFNVNIPEEFERARKISEEGLFLDS